MGYEEALGNSLILQKVWKYFPNKFLLSSCSLVSKCWNLEARTFIRDYRKCKARGPTEEGSDCTFIQELNAICCQMAEEGRVVPFNSVRIWLHSASASCRSDHIRSNHQISLASQLKLKFLEVAWRCPSDEVDCCLALNTVVTMLRENADEIRTLKLVYITLPACLNILPDDWFHRFSKLEELKFSKMPDAAVDSAEQIQVLNRILSSCPNLKRIAVGDPGSLRMLRVDKLKLLNELDFYFRNIEDQNFLRAVAEARPELRKLRIGVDSMGSHFLFGGQNFLQAFYRALEFLLESCHSTLVALCINSHHPIVQISLPTLAKLKSLELLFLSGMISHIRKDLVDIDYKRIMPKLEEVKIDSFSLDNRVPWPYAMNVHQIVIRSSAVNVRKLILHLSAKEIHLQLIKWLFPNVSSLELKMRCMDSTEEKGFLPLKGIFECWTDLKQLNIIGANNCAPMYHDDDFCGINSEEAELLREQDEEFLRSVHIVPIRPCLLTMSNLHELRVDFGGKETATLPEFAIPFISKVTDLVAFQRMPELGLNIVGSFSQCVG